MTGKELKKLRNAKGLSQAQFGQLIGKSQVQVSLLERRKVVPEDTGKEILSFMDRLRIRPKIASILDPVVESAPRESAQGKKRNPAIRELLEYGLSKSQIADLLGVHITTITHNEQNMPDKGRLEGQFELILGRLRTMEKDLGPDYAKPAVGALLYLQLTEPDHPLCRLVKMNVA